MNTSEDTKDLTTIILIYLYMSSCDGKEVLSLIFCISKGIVGLDAASDLFSYGLSVKVYGILWTYIFSLTF